MRIFLFLFISISRFRTHKLFYFWSFSLSTFSCLSCLSLFSFCFSTSPFYLLFYTFIFFFSSINSSFVPYFISFFFVRFLLFTWCLLLPCLSVLSVTQVCCSPSGYRQLSLLACYTSSVHVNNYRSEPTAPSNCVLPCEQRAAFCTKASLLIS